MTRQRRRPSGGGSAAGVPHPLDDLDPALQIARAILYARTAAGFSQAELATRMSTAPSFIAKLESGRSLPNTSTLVKVARATGTLLRLELVRRSGLIAPVATTLPVVRLKGV